MSAESAVPATPSLAQQARRWWNQLRYSFCALEFLLARHHRLGWHAELDGEAFERRVIILGSLRRRCGGKQMFRSPDEPTDNP